MEFYVEGLRSRTLKSLMPKLGKCNEMFSAWYLVFSTYRYEDMEATPMLCFVS